MSDTTIPPREQEPLQARVPISTYRLQLHAGFTFQDARAIIPYLARLGVGDLYCSPYFRACPGSTHGYDICDYGQLNPEIGSEADYDAFSADLASHDMGQILDFVPNHMAVEPVQNKWWRDMLEHGPASPFARFFDVDWSPVKTELAGKILLPFLGDHYGHVLERGELKLDFIDGGLVLLYHDVNRPIDPRQYPRVLRLHLDALLADLPADDPALEEFLSVLTALDNLPEAADPDPERIAVRLRESRLARERLQRVVASSPRLTRHIEEALRTINGVPGRPESFDELHDLLEAQPYRLAYWKTALHEINFRRFFDINQLAGLRIEDPAVFTAAHTLVLRLIRAGKVAGLRLDHLDGLFDPLGYLRTLQAAVVGGTDPEAGRPEDVGKPLYIVAEKILSGSESLPESWPVHGTTGYDFLNDLNRVFVDSRNARAMKLGYEEFTERDEPFADVVYDCKRTITGTSLASELNVLGHELNRISEGDRRARDFTLYSLRHALREIAASFPVYRTYVNADGATEADRLVVDQAIRRARRRNPAMEATVFDFARECLLPDATRLSEPEYRERLHFAMKFQQYTGPLQAKGLEDTAFYRYNVLVSLNEVGGDPQRFGSSVAQFHQTNQQRHRRYPYTMLATATHDTKRGEDSRARLNLLSEIPGAWQIQVANWAGLNAESRTLVDGEPAPDRNDEYLFYQTLLGAWPAEAAGTTHTAAPADLVGRLRDYMLKAVKEAKVHTSWISPNEAYDQAVAAFVEQTLTGPGAARFLSDFLPFQQRLARLGMVNSLAQVVLKVASPGVPDFYQGTELWGLNLVDPDNRRLVDFGQRVRYLDELEPWLDERSPRPIEEQTAAIGQLLDHWEDGRVKLFITALGLRLRRRLPRVFLDGDYLPLEATGELANGDVAAEHVVAFARRFEDPCVLAVVPRLVTGLTTEDQPLPIGAGVWASTRLQLAADLASRPYRNLVTGERLQPTEDGGTPGIRLADCFRDFPVALLLADG